MKDAGSAKLQWTGHVLVDVGIAGVCALTSRSRPEDVSVDDLDRVSDFIAENYFSGKLDPFLNVVFLNSGYCGPNKTHPKAYEDVFRAHRVEPAKNVALAAGATCVFSGKPAGALVHRQHLPLFSAAEVMNFRPTGQTAVPIASSYLVALQFAPMAGRRAEGRMLVVHADDPSTTAAFARRYLEDNRRLLALALPTERAIVHPSFAREQPMWDSQKKSHKMADVKGPRSLVLWDLTEIAGEAHPSDLRPHPVALTVYLLSNSGQGPSLEVLDIPSGAVSFVRRAVQGAARPAWIRIRSRFQPLRDSSDEPAARRRKKASAMVPGRAGWSRNRAFEDLCQIFDAGFADRTLAGRWLGRYVLGRPAGEPEKSRLRRSDASWALAELLLEEVLGMKSERIDAVKAFSDKLAEHILRSNERKLYHSIVFDKPYQLRAALIRAQRRSVDGTLLFGLDEYANAWLHEDGDEFLVRDLVAIRVVERLALSGYFEKNPEDLQPEQENEENAETAERER